MKKPIAVIGGINADICGRPAGRLILRDSNPGRVSVRPGGVGRNIAHNLRLLGEEVRLVTAIGDDSYGELLRRSCETLGIDLSLSPVLPGERSSTYLYVTDEDGDMQLAVSDMEISARLDPAYLAPLLPALRESAAVVLDANLPEESIRFLCEQLPLPIYADPVSTVKAGRLSGSLSRIFCLKPNTLEAAALTGEREPEKALRALLAKGVKRVFLSMGAQGMLAAEGERVLYRPCEQARVLNTTGAGDAATAAAVWAGVRDLPLDEALRAVLRAGAVTTECAEANNPALAALAEEFG